MFTGIVEEVGAVRSIAPTLVEVAARIVSADSALGDSIAVNGVCLTVARRGEGWFGADVMPETLRRTNLGALRAGHGVNLERPVSPTGRLGGHIVQGHVDGAGTVQQLEPEGDALLVSIAAPPALLRYIVEKGFIAVDGASLTVVDVGATAFRVSLVRYTLDHTIFGNWQVGQAVNLEIDILAKYVERLLTAQRPAEGRLAPDSSPNGLVQESPPSDAATSPRTTLGAHGARGHPASGSRRTLGSQEGR